MSGITVVNIAMLAPVKLSALDLNLLVVLHAVCEEGSVVAAARRLHVTPPAVSNALARLRASLDDPLFVRRGRGLTPTPRVLELAPTLARVFRELSSGLGDEPFVAARCTREFTIALADNDQLTRLPRLARAFLRALPRARLKAISVDALIAGGGLASSVADMALGPALDEPDLHAEPLFEEQAVCLVRGDHPRVPRGVRVLSRELFSSLRHVDTHIALGKPGVAHRQATNLNEQRGLVREVAVVAPTFAAAAMIAAHTDLVASLPRSVAETMANMLGARVLAFPGEPLRLTQCLLWHARTHRDPAAQFARALVTRTLAHRAGRRAR